MRGMAGVAAAVAAPTGSINPEVGDAEQALDGTLRNGDVLNVGKGDGHLLDFHDAFAHTQAPISHHIPSLFVIKTEKREPKQALENEDKNDKKKNRDQQRGSSTGLLAHSKSYRDHHPGDDENGEQQSGALEAPQ